MKKNLKLFIFLIAFSFLFNGCDFTDDIEKGVPDAFVKGFIEDINSDTLKNNVQWLQNYSSRFFLNENRKQIANDIKNKLISYGFSDTYIDSFYLSTTWNEVTYETWQYNVIMRITGSSNPENIYVIGAHYDSMNDNSDPSVSAPGANDNASGVAGLIEIARVFNINSFVPKNTIEFVFFASEENNLDGSNDYVTKAKADNNNIVMMLNNDMIAYEPNTDPLQWTLNVMDYDNSADLRTKFVQCGATYTNLNFVRNNEYNDVGDSYSFYQKSYEALFIINFEEETFYHTANDNVKNYNFDYCKEVISISAALLVQENK